MKNLTRSHPGSQVGDHAVSVGGFLTGVWPKRTEAEDVLREHDDRSDRREADRPGHAASVARSGDRGLHRLRRRLLAGLQLRLPEHDLVELADDAAADGNQPARGVRAAVRPGGHGGQARDAHAAAEEHARLDSAGSGATCSAVLGARDRARVSEYLDNIREIERRIQQAEAHSTSQVTDVDAPVGVPDSFEEHVGLMYDLLAAAYQADVTRVFTFMLSRELSQRTYRRSASPSSTTPCRTTATIPTRSRRTCKINTYHMQLFAKFLEKLRATPDGDGTLLDHSVIFYGGGMGNPNGHLTDPLPVVGARRRARQGPSPHRAARADAGRQPLAVGRAQVRRSDDRVRRRQRADRVVHVDSCVASAFRRTLPFVRLKPDATTP